LALFFQRNRKVGPTATLSRNTILIINKIIKPCSRLSTVRG